MRLALIGRPRDRSRASTISAAIGSAPTRYLRLSQVATANTANTTGLWSLPTVRVSLAAPGYVALAYANANGSTPIGPANDIVNPIADDAVEVQRLEHLGDGRQRRLGEVLGRYFHVRLERRDDKHAVVCVLCRRRRRDERWAGARRPPFPGVCCSC